MSSMKPQTLSVNQWVSLHKEELRNEFDRQDFDISGYMDCPECDGRGDWRNEYDELEMCGACDGDGQIEKTYEYAFDSFCEDEYQMQHSKDLNKFYRYCAIIELES